MVNFVRTAFQPQMLIIDDKNESLKNFEALIKQHGFNTVYEISGGLAMRYLANNSPSIVVISERCVDITSNELCYYIRSLDHLKNSVVIIIKFPDSMEKEIGYDQNGPNAYVLKDKDEQDVISKVKYHYMVNRSSESSRILRYGDIEMNLNAYTVTRKNKYIRLGPTEFKILQCFLEHSKNTLSREYIMNYVWGQNASIEPRTIDVHINRLRTALKLSNNELPLIETIRSVGYCLRRNIEESSL